MIRLHLIRRIAPDEMEEGKVASWVGGDPVIEGEHLVVVDGEERPAEDLSIQPKV
jgi:hypothetical protein